MKGKGQGKTWFSCRNKDYIPFLSFSSRCILLSLLSAPAFGEHFPYGTKIVLETVTYQEIILFVWLPLLQQLVFPTIIMPVTLHSLSVISLNIYNIFKLAICHLNSDHTLKKLITKTPQKYSFLLPNALQHFRKFK